MEIGRALAKAGDDPLAVEFGMRGLLHNSFGTVSNMDDVINGLTKYLPTLSCLRLWCDWLSGPDSVFSELIYLRGKPKYFCGGSYYVINADKAVPFCRRLFSYLFRFDLLLV